MRMHMGLAASIIAALGLWAPVQADTVAINNGSFESPVVPPDLNGFGALPFGPGDGTGWMSTGPVLELDGTNLNAGIFVNNADGNQLAFLASLNVSQTDPENHTRNAIWRDLGDTYVAGATYELKVDVGVSSFFPAQGPLFLELYHVDAGLPVTAATLMIQPVGLSSSDLQTFTLLLPVQASDPWAGQLIGVRLSTEGAGGFYDVDNLHLNAFIPEQVPEPASMGLIALAAAGLLLRRRA